MGMRGRRMNIFLFSYSRCVPSLEPSSSSCIFSPSLFPMTSIFILRCGKYFFMNACAKSISRIAGILKINISPPFISRSASRIRLIASSWDIKNLVICVSVINIFPSCSAWRRHTGNTEPRAQVTLPNRTQENEVSASPL